MCLKTLCIYIYIYALAKRWKVQFRQGFAYFNNNVDSKRHIIIRTAILYNEINSGQNYEKHYIYMYITNLHFVVSFVDLYI